MLYLYHNISKTLPFIYFVISLAAIPIYCRDFDLLNLKKTFRLAIYWHNLFRHTIINCLNHFLSLLFNPLFRRGELFDFFFPIFNLTFSTQILFVGVSNTTIVVIGPFCHSLLSYITSQVPPRRTRTRYYHYQSIITFCHFLYQSLLHNIKVSRAFVTQYQSISPYTDSISKTRHIISGPSPLQYVTRPLMVNPLY